MSTHSSGEAGLDDPTLAEPGPLRFGRYVVLGRIGAGAMGVVHRAYDEALDRKIALKILHSRSFGDRTPRIRLQREAQALAQLSHPNVVQIYDVGEWQGQDFVALEFVQGETLRRWLSGQARPWREIVEVFVQAGRGLAAAHAVGLVHRDFKPDNVLIGADGRVRVADFGLALAVSGEAEATAPGPEPGQSGRSDIRVTAAGALLGTPAYMAPEQFLRRPADARSDQFAYCVALFEALFGRRPFAGDSVESLCRNVLRGEMVAPPPRTHVPQWLTELVTRGLAIEPERRHPSMDALLAELTRDRGRGRRRLAWAAAAFGLAAGVAGVTLRPAAQTCQGAAERLAGAWDAQRAATVERALLATGLEFAGETWTRVRSDLDTYAAGWATSYVDACEAHRRGEQSSTALDLRMHCLQRRRGELAALVDVLAEADADTVTNAVLAAHSLSPVAACDDTAALLDEDRRLGLPDDPARASAVQGLRDKLAQVEALYVAGQIARSRAVVEEVLRRAEVVDDAATLAEALYWHAKALFEAGALDEATQRLHRAHATAVRADHEMLELRALSLLVYVQGLARDGAAAERSYEVASALVARLAPERSIAAGLLNNLAVARMHAGRLREAETLNREALALRRAGDPPDHIEVGISCNGLANVLMDEERFAEAEPLAREAVAEFRLGLGPQHPWTRLVEMNLALLLYDTRRPDEARAVLDEALPQYVAAAGKERADTADAWAVHGLLHLGERPEQALADLRHAHDLGERLQSPHTFSRTRFALAQGLWAHVPAERERALKLAREALEDATRAGRTARREEIAAWLAARPAESP